jgi:hypothetical protein
MALCVGADIEKNFQPRVLVINLFTAAGKHLCLGFRVETCFALNKKMLQARQQLRTKFAFDSEGYIGRIGIFFTLSSWVFRHFEQNTKKPVSIDRPTVSLNGTMAMTLTRDLNASFYFAQSGIEIFASKNLLMSAPDLWPSSSSVCWLSSCRSRDFEDIRSHNHKLAWDICGPSRNIPVQSRQKPEKSFSFAKNLLTAELDAENKQEARDKASDKGESRQEKYFFGLFTPLKLNYDTERAMIMDERGTFGKFIKHLGCL